jgi:hypothetical protein
VENPVTDDRLQQLENQLEAIKERNARVEADKAWESSATRIGTISAITYVIAAALLWMIGTERYWLSALIPTVGFFLSAQTLPAIKRSWIDSYQSRKN